MGLTNRATCRGTRDPTCLRPLTTSTLPNVPPRNPFVFLFRMCTRLEVLELYLWVVLKLVLSSQVFMPCSPHRVLWLKSSLSKCTTNLCHRQFPVITLVST